ncbi:MAG: tetratricopeptide repeat protein [Thiopseudomonas sp.]|nr:tetratricopeptide repeat protein [Thiopseudomonas sp.]MCK9465017.1 tetratricopeptide repeat protein [Thiopseudomonas sp.]
MDNFSVLWPAFNLPYALLLTPTLWLLMYLVQRSSRRVQQWEQILPKAFHSALLSQVKHDNRRWPTLLLGIASLCLGLALSQPHWTVKHEQITSMQIEPLVLVIQLTPESLATDLAPSRLQRIQHKVIQLTNLHEQANTAIVVYAGSAHTLVPLSSDKQAIENLLIALSPSLMPVAGNNAGLAVERAIQLLEQGGQRQGQILLFSYGLNATEQRDISKLMHNSAYQLSILGVGTTQGAPITDEQTGRLITDSQGNILISQLDELGLQKFSQKTGIRYARLTHDGYDTDQLKLTASNQRQLAHSSMARQDNQGFWFVLPLILLLPPLARRGWLLSLLFGFYLVAPQPSYAWQLPFITAQNPLEQILADPHQALSELDDPMWQGIAAYHAQDYPLAIEYFNQANNAMAYYNKANAFMQLENYEHAILSYEQALSLEPNLSVAQHNLHLAQELFARQNTEQEKEAEPETLPEEQQPLAISAQLGLTEQADSTDSQEHANVTPIIDIETWLNQIPDNPSELLRRKFWFEQFGTGTP